MSEKGPIYGVELIDTLPLGKSGMLQAMPTRDDLRSVRCQRVVAGYEVLLAHYLELRKQQESGTTPDANSENRPMSSEPPSADQIPSPQDIADRWYSPEQIKTWLNEMERKRRLSLESGNRMPPDLTSDPAFAEWLCNEYRLAMAKGIELERSRAEQPEPARG